MINYCGIEDRFVIFTTMCNCCIGSCQIKVCNTICNTTKGKSLGFLILIITGYIAGIISKLTNAAYMQAFGQKWYVLCFYVLNLLMVSLDVAMYFRNKKLMKSGAE